MEEQLTRLTVVLKDLLAEARLIRGELQRANEQLAEIKYDTRTKL